MRPAFHHDLVMARAIGLRHHAARERAVRAANRARRGHSPQRTRPLPAPTLIGLAYQVRTVGSGRHPSPTR